MDYPNTTDSFVQPKSAEELNQVLSAEIAAYVTTAARCEELKTLLDNQKRATEAQERSAKNYATKASDLEAMLAPLVQYIGEALVESGDFQRALGELVADQINDTLGDRDFVNAVEEAVGNLTFEVNVR